MFRSMPISNKRKSQIMLISSMMIYGTLTAVRKSILFPSALLAFLRGIIGFLFILFYINIANIKPSISGIKKNFLLLTIGGIFTGLNWVFLFESLRHTSISIATLCNNCHPIFVFILSPLILKERFTVKNFVSILFAFSGIVLISGISDLKGFNYDDSFVGLFLGLFAGASYSIVIISNKGITGLDAYSKTLTQLFTASLVMLPYVLININSYVFEITTKTIIIILIIGIFHTGIGYLLYFASIPELKPQFVSLSGYIEAIEAIILSIILFNEKLTLLQFIGILLIVFAIYIANNSTSS